jgi:hypothetical protein
MKKFVKTHYEKLAPIALVAIVAAIFITPFFVLSHLQTKARNQAIARAKQMDGRVYTIDNVAWNWIGDTKLILKNDRGENAGWVMIYMANPLDSKINPLTLAFTHPHDPVPVPMKVKAHFRETPWADKYDGKVKENFTGSFVEFEVL